MSKLNIVKNLHVGTPELERLRSLLEDSSRTFDTLFVKTLGLKIRRTASGWTNEWEPTKASNTTLQVKAGMGLLKDADGVLRIVQLAANTQVSIPTTSGTYNVGVEYQATNYEPGTLSVANGDTVVVGVGTKFSQVFALNRTLVIGSTSIPIATVTDDTHMTLEEDWPAASVVNGQFSVGGWFSTPPAGVSDRKIYTMDGLNIVVQTTNLGTTRLKIGQVVVAGSVITNVSDTRTDNVFEIQDSDASIDGTPALTFRIGVGTRGPGAAGVKVVTEDDAPMPPRNLRVLDVTPRSELSLVQSDMDSLLAFTAKTGLITHQADVRLAWDYTNVHGEGDAGSFLVTNSTGDKVWTTNQLAGYLLVIPSTGIFKITANDPTNQDETFLSVTTLDDLPVDLSAVDMLGGNYAAIVCGATAYELRAVPVNNSLVPQTSKVIEKVVSSDDLTAAFVSPQTVLPLNIGYRYTISVRAVRGAQKSAYTTLVAGSYAKASPPFKTSSVAYMGDSKPFLVRLPDLASPAVSDVSALSTAHGFKLNIAASAWTPASDFEVVYREGEPADFANAQHPHMVTPDRAIDVAVSGSRAYNVKVRPLLAGQAVDTAQSVDVTSGAGGIPPQESTIIVSFDLRTYRATLTTVSGTRANRFQLTNLFMPANRTTGEFAASGGTVLANSILVDSAGKEFTIQDITVGNLGVAWELGKTVPGQVTDGIAYINTTKTGRQILRVDGLSVDTEIYKVTCDVDTIVTEAGNGVIRWYQESQEQNFDSMIISQPGGPVVKQTDVKLTSLGGARNLIVDLWDAATPALLNNASISGVLTLYTRPYVAGV